MFDLKFGTRMALMYGNMGVANLRDNWVSRCLEELKHGAAINLDATIDLLSCLNYEDVTNETLDILTKLVHRSIKRSGQLSDTLKIVLLWNISRLDLLEKDHKDLLASIKLNNLKILDHLLLC